MLGTAQLETAQARKMTVRVSAVRRPPPLGPAGIEGGCSAIEFSGNRWDSTNSTTSRKKLDRLDRDLDELDRVLDQLDDLRVKIDSTDSIDSIEISTNSIEFSINSMSREVRVFLKMKFWR